MVEGSTSLPLAAGIFRQFWLHVPCNCLFQGYALGSLIFISNMVL